MGFVQVALSEGLKALIDRQVAAGRVESEVAYLEEAVRRYAADLDSEGEIVAVAEAGLADIEAGRYVTISAAQDAEDLHRRTMRRLRTGLTADPL